jgi:hypothetical protein
LTPFSISVLSRSSTFFLILPVRTRAVGVALLCERANGQQAPACPTIGMGHSQDVLQLCLGLSSPDKATRTQAEAALAAAKEGQLPQVRGGKVRGGRLACSMLSHPEDDATHGSYFTDWRRSCSFSPSPMRARWHRARLWRVCSCARSSTRKAHRTPQLSCPSRSSARVRAGCNWAEPLWRWLTSCRAFFSGCCS